MGGGGLGGQKFKSQKKHMTGVLKMGVVAVLSMALSYQEATHQSH